MSETFGRHRLPRASHVHIGLALFTRKDTSQWCPVGLSDCDWIFVPGIMSSLRGCHFTHNIAVLGAYLCRTIADNALAANGFLFTNFTIGTIMLPKVRRERITLPRSQQKHVKQWIACHARRIIRRSCIN
jgi:hypothetical protein